MIRGFELLIDGFELALLNLTRSFKLSTRNLQLATRNSCFTISQFLPVYYDIIISEKMKVMGLSRHSIGTQRTADFDREAVEQEELSCKQIKCWASLCMAIITK